jgi:hypothetical protein
MLNLTLRLRIFIKLGILQDPLGRIFDATKIVGTMHFDNDPNTRRPASDAHADIISEAADRLEVLAPGKFVHISHGVFPILVSPSVLLTRRKTDGSYPSCARSAYMSARKIFTRSR